MKVIYLIVLLIGIQINVSAGEGLNFKWMEGKREIGTLKIIVDEKEDLNQYNYSSVMNVDYGEPITFQDAFGSTYRNDSLVNATAKRSFNGRVRVSIEENILDDSQTRLVSGKKKTLERAPVVSDYVLLFVKAPVGITSVYSTLYGENFKVKESSKNTYTVIGAKNRAETFTYDEKGKLIKAVVNLNVGTYTLVPSSSK